MINLSASSLKAYLACQRSWYLLHVARAPRVVPAYVTAGTALDEAVQCYLKGDTTCCSPTDPVTARELDVVKSELPAPGTVDVQARLNLPCPGLEGLVNVTGSLDYLTPPTSEGLMVIGDLKRVWHKDAAHTPESLAKDVQALMYAWFVFRIYAPARIIWRWTYLVRAAVTKDGVVTRKPATFSVDVEAQRPAVEAWFNDVVLTAARGMLDIKGPVESVSHDPDSCEEGNRCFVRKSCPMHVGPVKGSNIIMDLSKFKTGASAAPAPRIAINPPAMPAMPPLTVVTASGVTIDCREDVSRETDTASTPLDVGTIEGPGAALLEAVPDTEPAPAPRGEPEPYVTPAQEISDQSRAIVYGRSEPAPGPELDADGADCRNYAERPLTDAERKAAPARRTRRRKNEPLTPISAAPEASWPTLESASTEAIMSELADRGWHVQLTGRS